MEKLPFYEKHAPLKNNFSVRILAHNCNKKLSMHWHDHLELLFFEGNPCTVNCGGKINDAYKDDLIIVNSNEFHSYTPKNGDILHTCVSIYPAFFDDVAFKGIILKNLVPQDSFVKECIRQLTEEHEHPKAASDMVIKAKSYELMAYLTRNYAEESLTKTEYNKRRANQKRVNDILTFIRDHYHENISTRTLAEKFYLSESYICCLFKREIGISPIEHINNLRINEAEILLKNTTENITSIAMKLGFSDPNYFARIFKKQTGITPREYKR